VGRPQMPPIGRTSITSMALRLDATQQDLPNASPENSNDVRSSPPPIAPDGARPNGREVVNRRRNESQPNAVWYAPRC